MSRTMFGFFLLAVGILASAPLHGQDAPAPTRIAVINVGRVVLNYNKAQEMKKELESELGLYRKQATVMQSDMVKLQQIVSDAKRDEEEKSTAANRLTILRRKMEDLDKEVRKVIGKKQEKQLLELFAEMQNAIQRHADADNIDLVLAYGEPLTDVLAYPNVARKFAFIDQGGVVPFFVRPRIDITDAIIKSLNESYASKK